MEFSRTYGLEKHSWIGFSLGASSLEQPLKLEPGLFCLGNHVAKSLVPQNFRALLEFTARLKVGRHEERKQRASTTARLRQDLTGDGYNFASDSVLWRPRRRWGSRLTGAGGAGMLENFGCR